MATDKYADLQFSEEKPIDDLGFVPESAEERAEFEQAEKYDRPIAAGLAGFAKGATFSLSDQFLTKSGLVAPETLAGLEKYNPVASPVGEVGGVLTSLLIPGGGLVGGASKVGMGIERGAAALLPEATSLGARVLQGVSTKGLGGAAEGAFYGAGQALHEDALGDPTVNAEKVLGHVGFGATIGGVFGGVFGGASPFIKGKKVPVASMTDDAVAAGKEAIPTPGVADLDGTPVSITSFDDISNAVKKAQAEGIEVGALPQKKILEEVNVSLADSKYPVHAVQLEAMSDPRALEIYKAVKESNAPKGKQYLNYESLQKTEGVDKIKETIRNLSPEKITDDVLEGGRDVGKALDEYTKAVRASGADVFETIKRVAPGLEIKSSEVLDSIQRALPDVDLTGVIKIGDDGALIAQSYNPNSPISKEAFKSIRDVVRALEGKNTTTIDKVRNVRSTIVDAVREKKISGRPGAEIGKMTGNLLELIENTIQKSEVGLPVKQTFRNYAINESRVKTLEDIIGGYLGDNRGILNQFTPEELSKKVFSDTNSILATKDAVPSSVFDKMVGDYLLSQVKKFTTDNNFSSKGFSAWMKDKAPELSVALADKPDALKRINDWAAKLRILPDATPMNPPNTARALDLNSIINAVSNPVSATTAVTGNIFKQVKEAAQNRSNVKELENILASGASAEARAKKMGVLERMVNTANKNIESLSSRLFDTGKDVGQKIKKAVPPLTTIEMLKDVEKIKKDLTDKTGSPDQYVDTVSNATVDLEDVAPEIASGVQFTMSTAAEFIKSKIPDTNPIGPLSPPRVPSTAELYKFFRYYDVVENPLIVMDQVRDGTLTHESMEAMNVVYPRLLGDLRVSIFDKLTDQKDGGVKIPYKTKMMLSAFLGKDLVPSITQESLQANQMTFGQESNQADAKEMAMAQKSSQPGKSPITIAQRSNSFTRSVIDRKNA